MFTVRQNQTHEMKTRFRLLVTVLSPPRLWIQFRPSPCEIIEGQNRICSCFSPNIFGFSHQCAQRKLFTLMRPPHLSRNDENKLIVRTFIETWNCKADCSGTFIFRKTTFDISLNSELSVV